MFKFLSAGSEGKKPAQVDVGQEILCLAVNNSTGTVAVGLQYGEILVLHNVDEYLRSSYNNNEKIGNKDAFLTKTTMHWHAHGVLTVAFSDDGKFLYSGGEESVLVAWNITRLTKNFLPRLGAPLCHLVTSRDAAKAAKVLTTTLDNSLRLVNTAK
jgi:NET1-associated nuclear protein 1 (U3 small nucleolar RNA-associated protein 17)